MANYDYPYIRDELIINNCVQEFYNNFVGDGPVFLLGRVVRHESGCDLRVSSRPLFIIADEYDGNGQLIDARGAFPGGRGGSVTVRCKRSVGVRITVSGGQGAGGATGADGTDGVPDTVIEGYTITVPDPWPMETTHEEWVPAETIPGTPGSPAGMGGRGGAGGDAGFLVFTSVAEDGGPWLEAEGGFGGAGGAGGFLGQEQAPSGDDGPSGASSAIAYEVVSEEKYLRTIRNDPVIALVLFFAVHYRCDGGERCRRSFPSALWPESISGILRPFPTIVSLMIAQ